MASTDPAIFREVCEQYRLDPGTFGYWKLEFLAELAEPVFPGPFSIPELQACGPDVVLPDFTDTAQVLRQLRGRN